MNGNKKKCCFRCDFIGEWFKVFTYKLPSVLCVFFSHAIFFFAFHFVLKILLKFIFKRPQSFPLYLQSVCFV